VAGCSSSHHSERNAPGPVLIPARGPYGTVFVAWDSPLEGSGQHFRPRGLAAGQAVACVSERGVKAGAKVPERGHSVVSSAGISVHSHSDGSVDVRCDLSKLATRDPTVIPSGGHRHLKKGVLPPGTAVRCVDGAAAAVSRSPGVVSGSITLGSGKRDVPLGSLDITVQTHKDGSVDVRCR
jgi:hypothetical protein